MIGAMATQASAKGKPDDTLKGPPDDLSVGTPENLPEILPSDLPDGLPPERLREQYTTIPSFCVLACGSSSNKCKGKTVPGYVLDPHPLRCCSDTEKEGWMKRERCDIWSQSEFDGNCYDEVNFFEAFLVCAKQGARLCSKDELLSDCTRGSGCGHNGGLIWSIDTWEPCVTDAECEDGLECTTNTCGGDGICQVNDVSNCLIATGCGALDGNCSHRPQRKADPAFHFHHVRCCSDSPLPGFVLNPTCSSTVGTVYGASEVGPPGEECQELKTYDEAVAACDAVEARLCTADELLNDCTADTGCGFDNRISWTSTVLA